MKIAIPSDDQITITKRTGQSKGFMVYETIDNKVASFEYRVNTQGEHDEEIEHSHKQIIELLKDVDILLVAAIGKYMKEDVDNSFIKYKLVEEKSLDQIIENFLKQ